MFVTVGVSEGFENFEYVGFAEAFVVSPAHSGKGAVKWRVSAQFVAKGGVAHVEHGGKFLWRVKHS